MVEPLLRLEGVSARYGNRTDAVSGIDLELVAGVVHGIIGANGAGKTTLLKAIGGLLPHHLGEIRFEGELLGASETAARRLRRGICLLPEGHRVISTLTVSENLSLATIGRWPLNHRTQMSRHLPFVHELFPVLKERKNQLAGHLSGGEQQMLSIGRALMSEPRLLLLDEPSLGLAPAVIDRIYSAINLITSAGITLLIVEQNHHRLARVSAQIDVLRLGKMVYSTGTSDLDESAIQHAYFD